MNVAGYQRQQMPKERATIRVCAISRRSFMTNLQETVR